MAELADFLGDHLEDHRRRNRLRGQCRDPPQRRLLLGKTRRLLLFAPHPGRQLSHDDRRDEKDAQRDEALQVANSKGVVRRQVRSRKRLQRLGPP